MANRERVLCESKEQTCFADTRVSNNDKLQQVIVSPRLCGCSVVVPSELSHLALIVPDEIIIYIFKINQPNYSIYETIIRRD